MVPYIPVRANIFHMLPDLVENLRSLIASQYAQADRAICGRGNLATGHSFGAILTLNGSNDVISQPLVPFGGHINIALY